MNEIAEDGTFASGYIIPPELAVKAMRDSGYRNTAYALAELIDNSIQADAVFVKGVVRRFHATSLISGALVSYSGLSQTGPAGCQLRVLPDQRAGFCVRAFA